MPSVAFCVEWVSGDIYAFTESSSGRKPRLLTSGESLTAQTARFGSGVNTLF